MHLSACSINKKRIKQLQQDGLLKSTDDESFDKCESCLSGKMTKKPFPHSNERAKDLLGIIHIDVCGPLRHVSRLGIPKGKRWVTISIPPETKLFCVKVCLILCEASNKSRNQWLRAVDIEENSRKKEEKKIQHFENQLQHSSKSRWGFTNHHKREVIPIVEVYQKGASGRNVTFLILYVDDIIIMGNHIPSLQSVKDYLGKCFAMKDLGEAAFILGIKIYMCGERSKQINWTLSKCLWLRSDEF
ncbi:retrotransposon protein, putative, ty1-copia subclass [Tanacetum coccineum]|uniref:Retrotransposon protein, putative, ty1-copia subclass n=1 Tax=Tanacetum coccineum TaxID=301880 RepID=A0ABQ5H0U6_9ASTR